jgi:hypothetical protein
MATEADLKAWREAAEAEFLAGTNPLLVRMPEGFPGDGDAWLGRVLSWWGDFRVSQTVARMAD